MTNFLLYVVDTHSLIWYLAGSKKLGHRAKEVFEKVHNGEGKIIVPIIVFVEIIFIVEKKKVDLDVEEIIERICSNPNYIIKPFDFEQLSCIKRRTNISEMHDRIIVCEAITSNAKIITKDKKIQESGIVEVIW